MVARCYRAGLEIESLSLIGGIGCVFEQKLSSLLVHPRKIPDMTENCRLGHKESTHVHAL